MIHKFKDKALEQTALTHKSFGRPHNERLEWLGDALLYAAVSEILWTRFPDLDEGVLTELRVSLVRNQTLAGAARRAGLAERLRLGAGEDGNKGREKDSILAAALEAHIGAASLDGGDFRALVAALLAEEIEARARLLKTDGADVLKSAKTRLQEVLQKAGKPAPSYRSRESFRGGRPFFHAECEADGRVFCGEGGTVSAAEKLAAALALDELG